MFVNELFALVGAGADVFIVRFCRLLGFVSTEFVVFAAYEIARKVILTAEIVFVIVRIFVALEEWALQMLRNLYAATCRNIVGGGVICKIRGV